MPWISFLKTVLELSFYRSWICPVSVDLLNILSYMEDLLNILSYVENLPNYKPGFFTSTTCVIIAGSVLLRVEKLNGVLYLQFR